MNIARNADIEYNITLFTQVNSHFEHKRNYIPLSQAYKEFAELISDYKKGYEATVEDKLKCYKGYQMEKDIVDRLQKIYFNSIKTSMEISAFDGKVKGHPDFSLNGNPGDCKSVLKDEWLPNDKLPWRVYCQMQAYMFYSGTQESYVVYESRESGILKSFTVFPDKKLQYDISYKYERVVQQIVFNKKLT